MFAVLGKGYLNFHILNVFRFYFGTQQGNVKAFTVYIMVSKLMCNIHLHLKFIEGKAWTRATISTTMYITYF